jgi:hypothetical protein
MNGSRFKYNMLTGEWEFNGSFNLFEKCIISFFKFILKFSYSDKFVFYFKEHQNGYNSSHILLLKFYSKLFNIFWRLYENIIIKSNINKYELYLQVISLKNLK